MIPKKIHYCWFGKGEMSQVELKCIESWRDKLFDYEIVEWNDSNFKSSNKFFRKAQDENKWAFMSDYARLKILYDHGGIYLDTDMLVLKSLDKFLSNNLFFGAESNEFINGAIIGSERGNTFIKSCLEKYGKKDFFKNDWGLITIPRVITSVYRKKYDHQGNFDNNIINGEIAIYSPFYFYPVPYEKKKLIDENYLSSERNKAAYAIHLWKSSWVNNFNKSHLTKKNTLLNKIKSMLNRLRR